MGRHPVASLGYGRALALIAAAGAVLRLAFIARQPLGYDEDFTAVAVHQPVGRMIDIVAHDSAPPLFYIAERGVTAIADVAGLASFGGPGGPALLRLIPVLAGIALIPLIAALARRVGGDTAGLWAAAFTAAVPSAVMLSGFARMYSPAATLTVASVLLLWRATQRPTRRRWVAYWAVAAAAVWTDYFSAVALLGILAAAVWLRPDRRAVAAASVATAAAVASIAPWLAVAGAQLGHSGQGFWVQPLGFTMLGGTLSQLFMGPPVDGSVPFGTALIALQDIAVLAGCAAFVAFAVAWRGFAPDARRAAIYCLAATSGVALLVAVSVVRPILDARYAGVMWLPLFALAGAGLASLPRKGAVVLLAPMIVASLALSAATTHTETSSFIAELDTRVGPHDLAAASWDHYLILLDEAGPTVQPRLHLLSSTDPPWYVGTAAYPAGAVVHEVPPDVVANGGRIFWVADSGVAPPTLPAGYRATESRCVVLACLTVYAPA